MTVSVRKPIALFNTLTRRNEILKPLNPDQVGLYCCGPTVYNFQHIGNLRTYIFEDLLVRALRQSGYSVKHVMNITDVGHLVSDADDGEDKMAIAARREKKSSLEIAEYYTGIFLEHCDWLNIKRPNVICKATDHINEMIELIKRLEEVGAAYVSGGNVYFDITKSADYGKLAGLDLDSLAAGARIEVDTKKRNAHDFALWFTKSKFEGQELQWDSPWGRGYPGWHIECSAMAIKYLGESFDIHCGGIDHIPVHHTNEIAQSETATSKPFASIWMHGGFLVVSGDKMSKSSGEFLTLDLLKEKGYDPLAYRLMCLTGHYRGEISWSFDALDSAAKSLQRLRSKIVKLKRSCEGKDLRSVTTTTRGSELLARYETAILNDLNMPQALAALHETLGDDIIADDEKLNLVIYFDQILGLDFENLKSTEIEVEITDEMSMLLAEREAARKSRNFKEADRIRDLITSKGFSIVDSTDGPKLKPLN